MRANSAKRGSSIMSVIERDYVTARDLIRKAELAGAFDGDDRHALRDAVKRLHGAAITNAGAVEDRDRLWNALLIACGNREDGARRYERMAMALTKRDPYPGAGQ